MSAETEKQIATTAHEVLELERSCQRVERVLDMLWETTHPGQEMPDDMEPEEVGRAILEAWAELGREQLERDDQVAAELERAQDGLSELQRAEAVMQRRGDVSIEALEAFLVRQEGKASAEAEPLRSVRLGIVQELAALMVRHCAPPAAGLLGGTALVDEQLEAMRPLNPGEVPECGAGRGGHHCTRPRGHEGEHACVSGFSWGHG